MSSYKQDLHAPYKTSQIGYTTVTATSTGVPSPQNNIYCISSKRRCGYYLFQLYRNAATIRGRRLFEVQTSRLLFISALPQCGDYSRVTTIRSTDVAATIYFSSTAMRRLFEVQMSRLLFISALPQCGDYSRATTIRSTDVAATIYFSSTAMRRLFEVQTSQLLFISALPQCGDYSRATTIRSTDVAATIYFSSTAMRRLFEVQTSRLLFISALPQCGDYSRAATIRSTDVAATIYFSSTAMRQLFEGGYYSKYRRRGYYLFQRYRNAATIRGRLLFEVQTSRLLFISALPQCGDYSRAATIRSTDVAATIYFSATAMRRLFKVRRLFEEIQNSCSTDLALSISKTCSVIGIQPV